MKRFTFILAPALILAFAALAHACPNCKESIPFSNADDVGGPPKGINASVYLMLGGFLSVLGFILWTVVKAIRSTPMRNPTAESAAA